MVRFISPLTSDITPGLKYAQVDQNIVFRQFGAMLAAIFIIEFGGAIAAFACQSQIAGIIRSKMEFAVHNFDQASTERQEAVNFLQDRVSLYTSWNKI